MCLKLKRIRARGYAPRSWHGQTEAWDWLLLCPLLPYGIADWTLSNLNFFEHRLPIFFVSPGCTVDRLAFSAISGQRDQPEQGNSVGKFSWTSAKMADGLGLGLGLVYREQYCSDAVVASSKTPIQSLAIVGEK